MLLLIILLYYNVEFMLIFAIILFGSCQAIFFTCNTTCLMLVSMRTTNRYLYNSL